MNIIMREDRICIVALLRILFRYLAGALDVDGDVRLVIRNYQHINVLSAMFSLFVFRCVGHIGKTHVNGMRCVSAVLVNEKVFKAILSGGAGDLRCTMDLVQQRSEDFMCARV